MCMWFPYIFENDPMAVIPPPAAPVAHERSESDDEASLERIVDAAIVDFVPNPALGVVGEFPEAPPSPILEDESDDEGLSVAAVAPVEPPHFQDAVMNGGLWGVPVPFCPGGRGDDAVLNPGPLHLDSVVRDLDHWGPNALSDGMVVESLVRLAEHSRSVRHAEGGESNPIDVDAGFRNPYAARVVHPASPLGWARPPSPASVMFLGDVAAGELAEEASFNSSRGSVDAELARVAAEEEALVAEIDAYERERAEYGEAEGVVEDAEFMEAEEDRRADELAEEAAAGPVPPPVPMVRIPPNPVVPIELPVPEDDPQEAERIRRLNGYFAHFIRHVLSGPYTDNVLDNGAYFVALLAEGGGVDLGLNDVLELLDELQVLLLGAREGIAIIRQHVVVRNLPVGVVRPRRAPQNREARRAARRAARLARVAEGDEVEMVIPRRLFDDDNDENMAI